MSKLKTYEVIVRTSGEWSGTVQAPSLVDAQRIGEQEFDEGNLQQCGEEVETVIAFKRRKRTGSWDTFERRFEPLPAPNHDYLWDIGTVSQDIDERNWWTVLDCNGRLYLSPGFRFVDRYAFVRCAKPWTDIDYRQPGYRYD